MLVIPGHREAEVGELIEVRRSRPVWPVWQHYISTKNTKFSAGVLMSACKPGYFGGWAMRITWTLDTGVAVSQEHMTASSLDKTEALSQTKKGKKYINQHTEMKRFSSLLKMLKVHRIHSSTNLWLPLYGFFLIQWYFKHNWEKQIACISHCFLNIF